MSTVETTNNNTRTYWLLFFVSTVAMIAMLIFLDEWFWVAMPFSFTYLVMALRKI